MKKPVLYVFAILLAISSCSQKNEEIFGEYFEEWGITIPYKDVSQSETYHLLNSLIGNMKDNVFYSLPIHMNPAIYTPTDFNNYLRNEKKAEDFFKRKDCVYVLISTYLTYLKAKEYLKIVDGYCDLCCTFSVRSCFTFLEFVLSSDIFMSKMSITEKVQLMVLALESAKYLNYTFSYASFTIMISIMQSSHYPPFVNNVKSLLNETGSCYYCVITNDICVLPGIEPRGTDLITKYAKQFINDNKKNKK